MKREEEIYNAMRDLGIGAYKDDGSLGHDEYDGNDLQNAFYKGAKWADEHPKSSWISVADDLPCNHEELLSGEHNTKGVEVVFQDRESGKRRVEVRSMIKSIQNRNSKSIAWYWNAYWDADIIYWRPIPEPPSD